MAATKKTSTRLAPSRPSDTVTQAEVAKTTTPSKERNVRAPLKILADRKVSAVTREAISPKAAAAAKMILDHTSEPVSAEAATNPT